MLGLAERLLSSIVSKSLAMAWVVMINLCGLPARRGYSFSVSPLFGCHFISRFSMRADRRVEHQREGGQHQDAGHHGVDVEAALGLQDQVAHALARAQVLAHHRADEGQAHAGVQAG